MPVAWGSCARGLSNAPTKDIRKAPCKRHVSITRSLHSLPSDHETWRCGFRNVSGAACQSFRKYSSPLTRMDARINPVTIAQRAPLAASRRYAWPIRSGNSTGNVIQPSGHGHQRRQADGTGDDPRHRGPRGRVDHDGLARAQRPPGRRAGDARGGARRDPRAQIRSEPDDPARTLGPDGADRRDDPDGARRLLRAADHRRHRGPLRARHAGRPVSHVPPQGA